MISKKFSAVPDQRIACFLTESDGSTYGSLLGENDGSTDNVSIDGDVLDAVESVTDLWTLAKMKESYRYEENDNYSAAADDVADVFPPRRGEDTSGRGDRPR